MPITEVSINTGEVLVGALLSLSLGKTLERPKSAILASKFWVKSMLAVFTSLCTIGGLHP